MLVEDRGTCCKNGNLPKSRETKTGPGTKAFIGATRLLAALPRHRRYLVGVSGGRDSVVLVHVLFSLGFRKLILIHLNHRLRGRAADADANFVARMAAKMGLEFVTKRVNVAARATEQGVSIELAARDARYELFAETARATRCRTIFLGHHADDRVETFLFNLFRGTGSAGLSSLRPESMRAADGLRLQILRPLLNVWRQEIDEYVVAHRLKFREDASNALADATRNRMRLRIIPALEKWFGRKIGPSILRTVEILAAEEDFLREQTPKPAQEIPVKLLRGLPVALQRRLIQRWLTDAKIRDISFDDIEAIRTLAQPGAVTAKINLAGGRHARRRAGVLFLELG